MSPSGFVAEGWGDETLDLSPLPSKVRTSLEALAHGLGEPVGITIRTICAWLDESGWEGSVEDAVTYYTANYCFAPA